MTRNRRGFLETLATAQSDWATQVGRAWNLGGGHLVLLALRKYRIKDSETVAPGRLARATADLRTTLDVLAAQAEKA